MNGILNLDKPAGMTSRDAVNRIKKMLPRGVKLGHAGTLDSFATGVLLVLIGKATKLSESLMAAPKQYETTIKFGATTETDDPDAPERPFSAPVTPISRLELLQKIPEFTGLILQTPPIYSAVKISGKRASDRVRAGQEVVIQPRRVMVYGIELIEFDFPTARLRIDCGRGTYIRSIARDLGNALGIGGYVTQLRRTRIGEFTIDHSVTLERVMSEGIENLTTRYIPGAPAR